MFEVYPTLTELFTDIADDKEVDLRADGAWVEWKDNYKIANDYTMGIWGRNFNPNSRILTFTNDEWR